MKSLIEQFLPQSLVEAVANDSIDIEDASPKEVEIVLVKIDESKTSDLKQIVSDVIEIGHENGAIVEDIVSSFVVLSFGSIGNACVAVDSGLELAQRLLERLGERVAIVYGREICLVGNHGSRSRMKYGTLLPNFWRIMNRLSKLKLGSIERL